MDDYKTCGLDGPHVIQNEGDIQQMHPRVLRLYERYKSQERDQFKANKVQEAWARIKQRVRNPVEDMKRSRAERDLDAFYNRQGKEMEKNKHLLQSQKEEENRKKFYRFDNKNGAEALSGKSREAQRLAREAQRLAQGGGNYSGSSNGSRHRAAGRAIHGPRAPAGVGISATGEQQTLEQMLERVVLALRNEPKFVKATAMLKRWLTTEMRKDSIGFGADAMLRLFELPYYHRHPEAVKDIKDSINFMLEKTAFADENAGIKDCWQHIILPHMSIIERGDDSFEVDEALKSIKRFYELVFENDTEYNTGVGDRNENPKLMKAWDREKIKQDRLRDSMRTVHLQKVSQKKIGIQGPMLPAQVVLGKEAPAVGDGGTQPAMQGPAMGPEQGPTGPPARDGLTIVADEIAEEEQRLAGLDETQAKEEPIEEEEDSEDEDDFFGTAAKKQRGEEPEVKQEDLKKEVKPENEADKEEFDHKKYEDENGWYVCVPPDPKFRKEHIRRSFLKLLETLSTLRQARISLRTVIDKFMTEVYHKRESLGFRREEIEQISNIQGKLKKLGNAGADLRKYGINNSNPLVAQNPVRDGRATQELGSGQWGNGCNW